MLKLWRRDFIFIFLLTGLLILSSCSLFRSEEPPANTDPNDKPPDNGQNGDEPPDIPITLPDEIKDLKPNELGTFMVLMYHEIGYPESEWCRTPENFRQDLETLYREGYRLVSLNDLLRGEIHVPPGTTPVVLTFDDANEGQFRYLEDGTIDPQCAVAIMEEMYQKHPDFGLAATFFIYYENPFRQQKYIGKKLNYLVEKGFEIGNHSYSHANLARISTLDIQRELAYHVKRTRDYLPGYQVNALALPYGAYPSPKSLAAEGSFEGITYRHQAVLQVGANPAPSPFHARYNPLEMPRIRASEMHTDGVGMYDWIAYFKANPERRYISDGNPKTVSFPSRLQEHYQERFPGKTVITY